MQFGEVMTRWTALIAVVLFAFALSLRSLAQRSSNIDSRLKRARLIWTVGCLIFLAHVLCAFHFLHGWSHAAAYEATARETFEMTGWNSGSGLYANYVFLIVWVADVLWWWRGIEAYENRPRWISVPLIGFLGFIAFNATVVFGDPLSRAIGICASAMLSAQTSGRLKRSCFGFRLRK